MKLSAPSRGLGHVALRCLSLETMTQFYCEVLGFRIVWQPDEENTYLSSGDDSLALHASADIGVADPSRLDHFGILVDRAEDVDAWAEHLQGQGVAIEAAPRTHRDGSRSIYFRDPEANRIQVLHLGAGMRLTRGQ